MISCQQHPSEKEINTGQNIFSTYDCDILINRRNAMFLWRCCRRNSVMGCYRRLSIHKHQQTLRFFVRWI